MGDNPRDQYPANPARVFGDPKYLFLSSDMNPGSLDEKIRQFLYVPWYREPVPGWAFLAMCVPLSLAMLIVLACVTTGRL